MLCLKMNPEEMGDKELISFSNVVNANVKQHRCRDNEKVLFCSPSSTK